MSPSIVRTAETQGQVGKQRPERQQDATAYSQVVRVGRAAAAAAGLLGGKQQALEQRRGPSASVDTDEVIARHQSRGGREAVWMITSMMVATVAMERDHRLALISTMDWGSETLNSYEQTVNKS